MSSTDYLTTLGTWETLRLDLKYLLCLFDLFLLRQRLIKFHCAASPNRITGLKQVFLIIQLFWHISEALSCKVQVLYLNEINITCFMQWYNKMLASFDHFSNMFLAVNPYPSMLHRLNIDKGRLPRNNVKPCSTQFMRSMSSPVWFSLYKKDDILIDFCSCA